MPTGNKTVSNQKTGKGCWWIIFVLMSAAVALLILFGMARGPYSQPIAKSNKAKTEISYLAISISLYKHDCGVYPDDTSPETVINALTGYKSNPNTLDESITNNPDWKGPYLQTQARQHELGMKNKALVDPWLKPYQFKLRKPVHNIGGVDIWSFGPDMQEGGGDDISNWKESTAGIPRELKTIIVVSVCLFVIVIFGGLRRKTMKNQRTALIKEHPTPLEQQSSLHSLLLPELHSLC
jgi:hypothetical protein